MQRPDNVIPLDTLNLGDHESLDPTVSFNCDVAFAIKDDEMPDVAFVEKGPFLIDMDLSELPPAEKPDVSMEVLNTDGSKSTNDSSQIKSDTLQQSPKDVHQSFIQAVKNQQILKIQEILNQYPDKNSREILLNTVDQNGRTVVHYAAEIGNCTILKYLVRTNHARFVSNEWQILPLHLAAKNGHAEAIEYLVGHTYGNPNYVVKENNYTALHLAVENDHYNCVIKLLKLGANPLLKTKSGKNALDLAKPGKIHNLLQSLVPATQILLDASWTPYCQKRDATYIENLRKYMGWRRTGKNWIKFKNILKESFENKDEPEVKNIIKMQCQTMVRTVRNKQASEQFLYYLCVNGYHEIIDFLLDYGIDFTYSTFKGESSLAMRYMGLYCAIDSCRLSVVEVFLKNDQRAQYYLYPKVMLEEKLEEQSRKITPLEFAEKKLMANADAERVNQYKKIYQLIQNKSKDIPPLSITNSPILEKSSTTIRKRRLVFTESIETDQFIPEIEPNSDLGCFTIEKRNALQNMSITPHTAQEHKKQDIIISTNEQIADKNHRSIGIWGEAHLFFSLRKRYEKKYPQMQIEESRGEKNSLTLHNRNNKSPDNVPIEIEIEWPNKAKWEQWSRDKKDKFTDPGSQSYDLKIIKKYNNRTKEKYIEVNSTTGDEKSKSVAVLTGKEFYFMRENIKNYRFFRCYKAGTKEAHFVNYSNMDQLLIDKNSPIVELKFYF